MIVLLNSGTHPELTHLANELRLRAIPFKYYTSSAIAEDELLARFAGLKVVRATRLGRMLRRRILPGMRKGDLRRVGVALEVLFQLSLSIAPSLSGTLLAVRTAYFRRVAGKSASNTESLTHIIANFTCARTAFARAPASSARILFYPIAHHDWMAVALKAEASANPDWAEFLQGHDNSERHDRLLDSEIALADSIFVASTFVRQTFIESRVEPSKLHVVPLGIDPIALWDPFSISGAVGERSTESHMRFLFVGQVNQRKGISYLLDAFSKARIDGASLTIVGPCPAALVRKASAIEGVIFRGRTPKFELGLEYARSDVLVLPSLAEGFGLVALEAMALGTPCIVTRRTLGEDVIQDRVNGFIVAAADSASLSRLFVEIAHDRVELQAIGQRAQATAKMLTWSRFASSVVDQIFSMSRPVG